MGNKKLLISVPVDRMGGIESHLVEWMELYGQGVQRLNGWEIVWSICRDRPVVSSRNRLVKKFLDTPCDALMTVDSDQLPFLGAGDKTGGLDLLTEDLNNTGVDVVNAITLRITEDGPLPVINKLTGPYSCELYTDILAKPKGLHRLENGTMGGAGILAHRHVWERFWREGVPWFKDVFVWKKGDKFDELSGRDLFGERLVGHDTWFFMRCHEFGYGCYVDTRVFWGHVKPSDLRAEWRRQMADYGRIRRIRRVPVALAEILRGQWGNEDWTPPAEFISRMTEEVAALPGDEIVVECGSGLTSKILCDLLPPERLVVLEHDADWYEQIEPQVNGSLVHAPLKEYGEYDWYELPDLGDRKVGLVICDGPPGDTRGGRFGAYPVLKSHFAKRFKILLDDVHRQGERDVLEAWRKRFGLKAEFQNCGDRAFAIIEGRNDG